MQRRCNIVNMGDIDPIDLSRNLSKSTGLKFPLGNDILEDARLSEKTTEKVMLDLGRHLGIIHMIKGKMYGLIDPKMVGQGKLVGLHSSWYEFIIENFQRRFNEMEEVKKEERRTKKSITRLSNSNRKIMDEVLLQKKFVLEILEKNKKLIESAPSRFLNGNIHMGSIIVKKGRFVGFGDFHQPILGDPTDDLAYFSIMPQGEKYLPFVLRTWKERIKDENLEEKLHLYRLLESYRKIIKRYVKYRYLEDYSEPLRIAQKELAYYNKR